MTLEIALTFSIYFLISLPSVKTACTMRIVFRVVHERQTGRKPEMLPYIRTGPEGREVTIEEIRRTNECLRRRVSDISIVFVVRQAGVSQSNQD